MTTLPTIFFATPLGGRPHPAMAYCLDLARTGYRKAGGREMQRYETRGGLALAHSLLAATFLESDADRLFFIHSDVSQFSVDDVVRLATSPHDVIAGAVPGRAFDYERIENAILAGVPLDEHIARHGSPMLFWALDGVARVEAAALEIEATCPGFLCLSRKAVEAVAASMRTERTAAGLPPLSKWEGLDFDHVFRESTDSRGHVQSEDRSFCLRWRALGGSVWLDLATDLIHWGENAFRGPTIESLLRERPMPTHERTIPFRVGTSLVCPASCEPCARQVQADIYDLPLAFFAPPTVLDLGANVGAFARWAIGRWPGASVCCYEPAGGDVARALAANTVHGMSVHAWAIVPDEREEVELYERPDATATSVTRLAPGEVGRRVKAVDAATLPDADVVKMDVEGDEPAILARYFERARRTSGLALEWHKREARDELRAVCARFGFRVLKEKPTEDPNVGVMLAVRT